MRRSARSVKIDYRVLNSAGENVQKYDQLNHSMESRSSITEISNLLTNCILNESNMTVSKKIIFSKLTNEEPTIYDQMMMS